MAVHCKPSTVASVVVLCGVLSACSPDFSDSTSSSSTYTLGGSILSLTTPGLVLTDGTDTLTVPPGASSFAFPTALAAGSRYTVEVQAQPTGMSCTVDNGSGTLSGSVSMIIVLCSVPSYPLGEMFSGLTAAGILLADGTNTVSPHPLHS